MRFKNYTLKLPKTTSTFHLFKKPLFNSQKKFFPIKYQLIITCILFAIIPLLIINTLSSSISKKTLRETSQHLTEQMLNQASLNITTHTSQLEKTFTRFIVTDLLQSDLFSQYFSSDTLTKARANNDIRKQMIYLESLDPSIQSVTIVPDNEQIIGQSTSLSEEDFSFIRELKIGESAVWKKGLGQSPDTLFFLRGINFEKAKCTLVAEINIKPIDEILNSIQLLDNSTLMLVDSEKNFIFDSHPEATPIIEDLWGTIINTSELTSVTANNVLTTFTTLDNSWKLISQVPVSSLTQRLSAASKMLWLSVLLLALLATLVGASIARSFSKPIVGLMQLMKKAEAGDLTVSSQVTGNNEVTQLCNSFNYMIANICSLLKQTQAVIAHTLEDSKQLTASTQYSVEAFEQLAASVDEISKGTVSQAENANSGSVAMANLAENIQEVLKKSHQMCEKSQGAKVLIQKATQSMTTLDQTTSSATQIATSIGTSILELSHLNKGIEGMMQLVDGISEQTNLLALNASIEAARAGEAGRGFSVVAQQVRTLSEQSKDSTVKVRQTLNEIEQKNISTTQLIASSHTIFSNQESAVQDVSLVFTSIIDALKTMDMALEEVTQQLDAMEKLKENTLMQITSIASITEESAASTQEVSALSEEQKNVIEQLSSLSSNLTTSMTSLNESIQAFRLK